MKRSTTRRGPLRSIAGLGVCATLLATGCAGLELGSGQATTWYTLEPPPASLDSQPARIDKVLLLGAITANPFYDSTQLAYSRSQIARAYYQYAAWTERPARRLVTLLETRLLQRGAFLTVAESTAGIRGDLLLQLSLDEIYHDAAAVRPVGRVAVRAELIDSRNRTLVARERFEAQAPVATSDAAGAVRAMNAATGQMLDDVARWVEVKSR